MEASDYIDKFVPFSNFEELDQYNSNDVVEALNVKKLNRKQQMMDRRQKLLHTSKDITSPLPKSIIRGKEKRQSN